MFVAPHHGLGRRARHRAGRRAVGHGGVPASATVVPGRRWLQWNDRFRDDVRGFLRGEPGLVPAMVQRVQGSPDLFGRRSRARSLNFLTAHDGLTMHDLTTRHRRSAPSWDCGPDLRLQQLQNYFTVLLLSAGTPMLVMGDEFGRTQDGHDNPYDVDGPLTWVDWSRLDEWRELYRVRPGPRPAPQTHTATSHWGAGGPASLSFSGPSGPPDRSLDPGHSHGAAVMSTSRPRWTGSGSTSPSTVPNPGVSPS